MLKDNIIKELVRIGNMYNVKRIVLFGSRARGDERPRSDIDIAVYGLPLNKQSEFLSEIDRINTLLEFDVVFVSDATSPLLLENINKDGVTLMNKFAEKYSNLVQAVSRLEESLLDYKEMQSETVRDGVIQRFEFCVELAWKTLREYLIDQGYVEINSPKGVMKVAFAVNIIDDESGWIDMINARNMTAHLYDEQTAKRIYTDISTTYISLFRKLIQTLKE